MRDFSVPFVELSKKNITNYIILLDVDGTLVADASEDIDHNIRAVVEILKQKNQIYLCSNSFKKDRLRRIASDIHLSLLESGYRKPSKKILKSIQNAEKRPVLMIGDKFLTDVLFAKRCSCEYIKVQRITSKDDHWCIKFLYFLDDAIFFLARFFV